jgi:hypothetical protein
MASDGMRGQWRHAPTAMTDRDDLLARVDNFTPTTDQDAEIIEALRAALAAAEAARSR